MEILDYTDDQGNVEIRRIEEGVEVVTHTPEWIPIGEDGEQYETNIIKEETTSDVMEVVAKIKSEKKTEQSG